MKGKISILSRKELLMRIRGNYKQATRKEKRKILDGFIATTGYGRKYAISLLNGIETDMTPSGNKRHKEGKYNQAVQSALLMVWQAANQICGKRLVPFLPSLVEALERYGHLSLPADVRQKLLSISPATADRLLKVDRQTNKKGVSTTKPGSLLKRQIPIRTFADWDNAVPGFFEADLVAHCGDCVEGAFLNTLVLTDIASGWTEFFALLRKGEAEVISALKIAQALLLFSLLGIDTDNGSEFINYALLNFCQHSQITFTRSRAYRKNDQAHVEEKNGSIVRRLVGYDRYEGMAAHHALAQLYGVLRLYVNFFQPSMKLISKERNGAKVTKKYDKAQTPYQRLLCSPQITAATKLALKKQYDTLDPVHLLKELKRLQDKFWEHAWKPKETSIAMTVQANSPMVKDNSLTNVTEPSITTHRLDVANRYYRKTYKPKKTLAHRTWRTRKDPFEGVWGQMCIDLSLCPHLTAKSLLEGLIQRQPDRYNPGQLRTLQRRVNEWRSEQVAQENHYKMVISLSAE